MKSCSEAIESRPEPMESSSEPTESRSESMESCVPCPWNHAPCPWNRVPSPQNRVPCQWNRVPNPRNRALSSRMFRGAGGSFRRLRPSSTALPSRTRRGVPRPLHSPRLAESCLRQLSPSGLAVDCVRRLHPPELAVDCSRRTLFDGVTFLHSFRQSHPPGLAEDPSSTTSTSPDLPWTLCNSSPSLARSEPFSRFHPADPLWTVVDGVTPPDSPSAAPLSWTRWGLSTTAFTLRSRCRLRATASPS